MCVDSEPRIGTNRVAELVSSRTGADGPELTEPLCCAPSANAVAELGRAIADHAFAPRTDQRRE